MKEDFQKPVKNTRLIEEEYLSTNSEMRTVGRDYEGEQMKRSEREKEREEERMIQG